MIQELKFEEAVRKRPGMFLGSIGDAGVINLIKGLLSDCLYLTKTKHCVFTISLVSNQEFIIRIDASDNLDRFEKNRADSDYTQNINLKVCEILSDEFDLVRENNTTILIHFRLAKSIFTEFIDYHEFSEAFMLWTLLNRNTEVSIIDKRSEFLNQNYYHFPEGVKYLYDRLLKKTLGKPQLEIIFNDQLNGRDYQICLGYRSDWYPESVVASYANDIVTIRGGSLVDGVMDGFRNGLRKYIKTNELVNHKIRKKKFENGLILIASVRGDGFNYHGSVRESLDNQEVRKDVKLLMTRLTFEFLSQHKSITENFLTRFDETNFLHGIF